MSRYRLRWPRRIRRKLRDIPEWLRREITQTVLALREDPYPPASEPLLRELTGLHRIRINGWRIIYKVEEADRVVLIRAIRPRDRNTYLNLRSGARNVSPAYSVSHER